MTGIPKPKLERMAGAIRHLHPGTDPFLGRLRARSSPHTGSKRGYTHLTDPAPAARFERAQAWHASTGRPLPPQMRPRQRLQPPAAMDVRARFASYTGYDPADLGHLTVARLLDAGAGTPARRRRLLHKAGQHGERPAGFTPQAAVTPGRPGPHSPAQRRRAAKDARQRARHDARIAPAASPWASPDADVAGDLRATLRGYADETTRFEEGA